MGDAGVRPAARLDQWLGDLPGRHHRDGVARGDRQRLHVPAVRPTRARIIESRADHRSGRLDRADDMDLLPRDRAVRADPDDAPRPGDLHAGPVHRGRADQGVRGQPGQFGSHLRVLVQPVRPELDLADRRRPARHLHLLGLGLGRRRQRGVARPPPRTGQGRGRLDADPAGDLRPGHRGGPGLPRHEVPGEQLRRRPQPARSRRVRLPARQAADHLRPHVGLGLNPDDDLAHRADHALDGEVGLDPEGVRHASTPASSRPRSRPC